MITTPTKSKLDANSFELYHAAKAIAEAWVREEHNLLPSLGVRLMEVIKKIEGRK